MYEIRIDKDLSALREAVAIASELNIPENQTGAFLVQRKRELQNVDTLYLKGTKLLSAEIIALRERIGDSRFRKQVRVLEEENRILEDLKQLDLPKGVALEIVKLATEPLIPIAPNKPLILVFSVTMGCIGSILYVLVRSVLRKYEFKINGRVLNKKSNC